MPASLDDLLDMLATLQAVTKEAGLERFKNERMELRRQQEDMLRAMHAWSAYESTLHTHQMEGQRLRQETLKGDILETRRDRDRFHFHREQTEFNDRRTAKLHTQYEAQEDEARKRGLDDLEYYDDPATDDDDDDEEEW